MIVRPPSQGPAVFAVRLPDWQVVDARDAPPHEAVLVELPVLVAVGAEPVARVVMPLVSKAHRYARFAKGPELLDEPVVELLRPFAPEERDDRVTARKEFDAVAPHAVHGVGERYPLGITGVPGVFGHAHFLSRGFEAERRERRPAVR